MELWPSSSSRLGYASAVRASNFFQGGKSEYMRENLNAVNLRLTTQEVQEIRELVGKANVATGDRYPAEMMRMSFEDTPELK